MIRRRVLAELLRAVTREKRQQGDDGLRTSVAAAPGASVTVNVGPNDHSVRVVDHASGSATTVSVEPGKDTQVTIPSVPGGSVLNIEIGTGTNKRVIVVEVVELNGGG